MKSNEFTNDKLAWRIRFKRFKDMPSLMSEREGKIYLMPTDNSAFRTFASLTGKDNEKINNMPTEVYTVNGDAMVGEMYLINLIGHEMNQLKKVRKNITPESAKETEDYIEELKQRYLNTRVSYNEYKPGMFRMPEILAEPNQLQKLNKSVTYNKDTGEIVIRDKK